MLFAYSAKSDGFCLLTSAKLLSMDAQMVHVLLLFMFNKVNNCGLRLPVTDLIYIFAQVILNACAL